MNVYKFGGASVKDAEGVKNLFKIINTQRENLIIVVSAMGKMTDALEVLCNSYFGKTGNIAEAFQRIQDFHQQITMLQFLKHYMSRAEYFVTVFRSSVFRNSVSLQERSTM